MKLIDKDAVLAEIKELSSAIKIQLDCKKGDAFWIAQKLLLERLKGKVNSLEVKEVDLEKEVENLIEKEKAFVTDNREVKYYNGDSFNHIYELEFIAKHFFELGIKAQKGEEV